jgi:hypothetical protein
MKKLLYMAYGSNLHPHRIQKRVPSAHFHDTVVLSGWQLQFHKRGRDRSAKCDIMKSVLPSSRVYGALYVIETREKEYLDQAEGLGKGYDIMNLQHPEHGSFFCYVASPSHIDSTLKPYTWYKDYVHQGALFHNFPRHYIDKIEAVAAITDDNSCRCQENQDILAQMQVHVKV